MNIRQENKMTDKVDCWYEELFGLMLDHDRFVTQFDSIIKKYPNFETFESHFYEANPVCPTQYKFINDQKYTKFKKMVDKEGIGVSLESITHGE